MEYPEGDSYDDILSDRSDSSDAIDVTSRGFRMGITQTEPVKPSSSGPKESAGVKSQAESCSWHSSTDPSSSHQLSAFSSASNLHPKLLLSPAIGGSTSPKSKDQSSPRAINRTSKAEIMVNAPLTTKPLPSSHVGRKIEGPRVKEAPDYETIGGYVVGKNRKSKLQRVLDEVPSLPSSPPSSPSSRVGIRNSKDADAVKSFVASPASSQEEDYKSTKVPAGIEAATQHSAKSSRKKRRLSVFVKKPTNDNSVEGRPLHPSTEGTSTSFPGTGSSIAHLIKRSRRYSAPEVPATLPLVPLEFTQVSNHSTSCLGLDPLHQTEASAELEQKPKAKTLWKLKFGNRRKSKEALPVGVDEARHGKAEQARAQKG